VTADVVTEIVMQGRLRVALRAVQKRRRAVGSVRCSPKVLFAGRVGDSRVGSSLQGRSWDV